MEQMKVTFDDIDGESSHQVKFALLSARTWSQYKNDHQRVRPGTRFLDLFELSRIAEPAVDPQWKAAELLEAHDAKIDDFESLDDVPVRLLQPAAAAMSKALQEAGVSDL